MFSKIELNQSNEILVVVDPILLKKMPERWFSNGFGKIIADLNISDNPAVLFIKLKDAI
jgi:hypothetical protein